MASENGFDISGPSSLCRIRLARRVLLPSMPHESAKADQLARLVLWLADLDVHTFLGDLA